MKKERQNHIDFFFMFNSVNRVILINLTIHEKIKIKNTISEIIRITV